MMPLSSVVEQLPVKQLVEGSNPPEAANHKENKMQLTKEQKVNMSKAFTEFLQTIEEEKVDCEKLPASKIETITHLIRVTKCNVRSLKRNQEMGSEPIHVGAPTESDRDLDVNLLISCLNSIQMELGITQNLFEFE